MNNKNTFIVRQNNKTTNQPFIALKIIEHFLSLNSDIRLIPDSPLYKLAVTEYNTIITNSLARPPIPKWFCGRIDSTTGELSTTTDQETRAINGVSTTPASTTTLTAYSSGAYPVDVCLVGGTPASPGYSTCVMVEEDIASFPNYFLTDYSNSFEPLPHVAPPNTGKNDKRHVHDIVDEAAEFWEPLIPGLSKIHELGHKIWG